LNIFKNIQIAWLSMENILCCGNSSEPHFGFNL